MKLITIITLCIAILSGVASSLGIFTNHIYNDPSVVSVRGKNVKLYGKGVYHHMSEEVAPQGIAQDVVTLFIAIPLLLTGLIMYRKGLLRGQILLTGMLGYFLVTYMFFTMMAMYNALFLLWVILLSLSFYGFLIMYRSLSPDILFTKITSRFPHRSLSFYLMFTAVIIALLWLSIVIPPVFSGTIPVEVEHYTTLVVQALDLSILLPASFIAGLLLKRKLPEGYRISMVYIVFLSVLMTALTAKIVAMSTLGYKVIPAIFIIPVFNLLAIIIMVRGLKAIPNN